MIKRDRNHPSLVIYNLHNERGAWPQRQDYDQMRMAHAIDPTRILTYNSSNGENPLNEPNARFKLHLLPYDCVWGCLQAGLSHVWTMNTREACVTRCRLVSATKPTV